MTESEIIPFGDFLMWTVRRVFGTSEHALAQEGKDFANLLTEAPIVALCPDQNRAIRAGTRIRGEASREHGALDANPELVFHGIFRLGRPFFRGKWQAVFIMPMFFTENTEITRKVDAPSWSPAETERTYGATDLKDDLKRFLRGEDLSRLISTNVVVQPAPGVFSGGVLAGTHAQGGAIDIRFDTPRVLQAGDTLTLNSAAINVSLT